MFSGMEVGEDFAAGVKVAAFVRVLVLLCECFHVALTSASAMRPLAALFSRDWATRTFHLRIVSLCDQGGFSRLSVGCLATTVFLRERPNVIFPDVQRTLRYVFNSESEDDSAPEKCTLLGSS
jgi:hypothetical protein